MPMLPIPPAPPLPAARAASGAGPASVPRAPPLPPRMASPPPAARAPVGGLGGISPLALQAAKANLRPIAGPTYPPTAFHFVLTFGTQSRDADGAFHEVSGIGPEVETETVLEGGLNGFSHVLPKSIRHPRLVLKRGIAGKASRLVRWCQDVLDGGFVKPIVPQLVHIYLLDHEANPLRGWSVENAWPVKWETEGFHAMRNQVAMEKIELAYARSNRIC